MARAFTPKVVTANDLLEGDVIYQTEDDRCKKNRVTGAYDVNYSGRLVALEKAR